MTNLLDDFEVIECERYTSRLEQYEKKRKYRREVDNTRKNLDRSLSLHIMLERPLHNIDFAPLRCEFGDVFRVSEQGKGTGLAPFRLYFALDESQKKLYLLCIGHKDQQKVDLEYCKEQMKKINATSQKGVSP